MADDKSIQDAANAYVDITARLREITQLQDMQLAQMRNLNVQNSILSKTKASHLSNEQRLASLQTSIQAKTAEILFLEERRLAALATGGAANLSAAAGLAAIQSQMTREVHSANAEYARLVKQMAVAQAITGVLVKSGFAELTAKSKEFRESWNNHPILGLGKVLEYAIEVFNKMDTAASQFRMNMGITREYIKTIDANAREIAFNLAHVGVSAEHAYKATEALSKGLFSTMSASKSLVTDVALISAQLGVAAETSADFMKSMGIISRTTASAQDDMTLFAAKMSQAAGVPLAEIMQDISNAAKSSYSYISRSGLSLIKASVDAKRMGTTLDSAAKSSKTLMDFTSSVRSEMEASVLVGKSINLQHARELSYRRDLKGLNAEILRIMKDANFEQLDPFQAEAVANALGKSSGELAAMAQAERERLGWESSTDPIVKSQLAAYKEMEAATEFIAKARGRDMRSQLQQKANQSAIVSITQSWNAILQRIGEGVLPLIDSTLKGIARVVGVINTGIGYWNAGFAKLGTTMGWIGKMLSGIAVAATLIFGMKGLGRLAGWATGGVGKAIQGMFTSIGRGVGAFGGTNVLRGALGIAALGVALWVFGKSIQVFAGTNWKAVFIGIGALSLLGVVAGIMGTFVGPILLGALAIAALGVALIPFAAAAWIASKALQNMAEVPFMKVATGLTSLGLAMMPLAFATPFMIPLSLGLSALSLALRLIAGPSERVGMAMANLGSGMKMTVESLLELQNLSLTSTVLQVRSLASAITDLSKAIKAMPDLKVEKLKNLVIQGIGIGGTEEKKGGSSPIEMLAAIKDGIEGLRMDMKNGVLTANVYLDSQKLDSGMARRLNYTGQLT